MKFIAEVSGTVSSTPLALSASTFPGLTAAQIAAITNLRITAHTNAVSYSLGAGTTPSATVGHAIAALQTVDIEFGPGEAENFKIVRNTADAAVTITAWSK